MGTVTNLKDYRKSQRNNDLVTSLNTQFFQAKQSGYNVTVLSCGQLRQIYAALGEEEPAEWRSFSNGENLGIEISKLDDWRHRLEKQSSQQKLSC